MRTIWYIFRKDLLSVFRNPFAALIAAGIMLLPSLYAWFNIAANWDPYGNTGGLKVAVVNEDMGFRPADLDLPEHAESLLSDTEINIGEMVIDNLKKNNQIGWQFVDEEDAMNGVSDGSYYAAVVIPASFSRDIASILTEDVTHPEIAYYVNEKKNAIATKITDKGVGTIQQQVNESFVGAVSQALSSVMNLAGEGLSELENKVSSNVLEILSRMQEDTKLLSTNLKALEGTLRAAQQIGDTARDLLPDFSEILPEGQIKTENMTSAIDAAHLLTKRTLDQMDDILSSMDDLAAAAENASDFACSIAETDSVKVQSALQKAIDLNQKLLRLQEGISAGLTELDHFLPGDSHPATETLLQKMSAQIDRTQLIIDRLYTAKSNVSKGVQLSESLLNELSQNYDALENAQRDLEQYYRKNVKNDLLTSLDDIYDVLSAASNRMALLESSLPHTEATLDGLDITYAHLLDALSQLNTAVDYMNDHMDRIYHEGEKLAAGGDLDQLLRLIQTDPESISEFMASPVTLTTHKLYPIENYGSAMTPFYTVLCLWVGGLILAAILKCEIREDDVIAKATHWQKYLGRYMIFLLFAVVQGIVVAAGDLLLLKIQCLHPGHFVLAAIYTAFVFSLFIYTLTISFGDVGKAIAVVFLVIQVAGAGGTFPIEVTPLFFRVLNPLMPFTHMINAMRECVGGMYENAYWMDFLKTSPFIPISLLIGIVLRTPLIRLKHFFEEKLEETGLM
ncbi:YhgE/Pip domain-containing protein [Anaerotignum lactatifermentans]|uniref:YhgE/Pip domain-containing protein n=1 Tax=Anaerotignum lactatifermentans TaxID=160404 RepID=A0ABS2G804_9FIRM|nr:YhgE/Pip domain-containing protein [Anaerotignum lactatifermentans]MBM6828331.1 YhgE/Pip domain-containing protein [Anaerotignum lactatifermentans]MBM6877611.1 YhgE/Pip domain-containing protein [Anaerotignum lactatifermentans]MBM6949914.1 YhgE/Pip domain-containing protein [Anaerotignum lactatifermentans]